jgi:hypothetical protein
MRRRRSLSMSLAVSWEPVMVQLRRRFGPVAEVGVCVWWECCGDGLGRMAIGCWLPFWDGFGRMRWGEMEGVRERRVEAAGSGSCICGGDMGEELYDGGVDKMATSWIGDGMEALFMSGERMDELLETEAVRLRRLEPWES